MVQKLRALAQNHWQNVLTFGIGGAGLAALLFWRLGSLLPGYAAQELETYQAASQPSNFLDNPMNAPFHAVVKALSYLIKNNLLATRLTATIFGVVFVGIFYLVIRRWHGQRVAVFSAILLGTSAWFLHTARLGTPDILLSLLAMLFMAGFWLKHSYNVIVLGLCMVLLVLLLYVPGMVWFIIAGMVWQWRALANAFGKHIWLTSLALIVALAALAPLVWAIYKDMSVLWTWLGLPQMMPTMLEAGRNLLQVPLDLAIRHQEDPLNWLGVMGILDVFTLVMAVLGGYLYLTKIRLVRTHVLLLILLIGAALIALGGPVSISVLVPFMFIMAAAGIDYLLGEWFRVFPRNPIARNVAYTAMGFVVLLSCAYNLRHYFVGWPQATATREVFVEQQIR